MKRFRIRELGARKKLAVHCETVIHLSSRQLESVVAGRGPASAISCAKTACTTIVKD
jgi:hypothetical protein